MNIILRLTPLLIIINLQNCLAQDTSLNNFKPFFEKQLNLWTLSFKNFKLSNFAKTDTRAFQNINIGFPENLKDFYSIYKSAITFSPDQNQFIDIYSYELNLERKGNKIIYSGSEVDQEISLCNVKTKKRNRVLFFGTSTRIEEVTWMTNTTFILVGSRNEDESKFIPVIYIGNTTKNIFEEYSSSDTTCVSIKGYTSPKLKRLNIQEE